MHTQTVLKFLNLSSIANFSSVAATLSSECNGFRGIAMPNGTVRLGPDFTRGNYTGFSMFHDYEGQQAPYGAISQMPMMGHLKNPFTDIRDTPAGPDECRFGYYKAVTSSNITVELGASKNAGLYQYTFPKGENANIVVDVSHVLQPVIGEGLRYLNGKIEVLSDRSYNGVGQYLYQDGKAINITFCGYFNDAAKVKLFIGNPKKIKAFNPDKTGKINCELTEDRVAAVFSFPKTNITSRVGISLDEHDACDNVNSEIPFGMSLQAVSLLGFPKEISPSSTGNATVSSGSPKSSTVLDILDPEKDSGRFRIFMIFLALILGGMFLCIIILFALCVGAHKHFKKNKNKEVANPKLERAMEAYERNGLRQHMRDGAADMPPRL